MDDLPIACIFTSTRSKQADEDYELRSARLEELVQSAPGYRGHESVRDPVTGRGITVAYFDDESAMDHWRTVPEHLEAQRLGRREFYEEYTIQIVRIVDQRSWSAKTPHAD